MTAPDELRETVGRHLAKARTPRDRIGLIGSVGLSVALIVWIATSLLADPSDRRLREMPSPPEAKKMKDSKREAKSPPPEPRGLAILVLPAPPPEVSPSAVAFPAPTAEPGSGPQAESMTPPKQPPRPLPRPALTASQTTGQERAQALAARFEPLRPALSAPSDKNRPPLKPMLNPTLKMMPVSQMPPVLIRPLKPEPVREPRSLGNAHAVRPAADLRPAPPPSPRKIADTVPTLRETAQAPARGKDLAIGRVALRNLEHGKGPGIEIGWPDNQAVAARLYSVLAQCHGLRSTLMSATGDLYVSTTPAGQPWKPNLDRLSGFARRPTGTLPAQEQREIDRIRATHGEIRSPVLVRVFDRRADASLLAGLKRLAGKSYDTVSIIRAAYALEDGAVVIERVALDGNTVPGRFRLNGSASCG